MRKQALNSADYWFLLSVLVLGCLVYAPLLKAGFIWDDDKHLVNDVLLENLDGLYKIWFSPGKSVWNYWPLTRTSFWLERLFFGTNPAVFHAVNIALHLTSSCIFYFVLKQLRAGFFSAAVAAMLFAVHPIMMESVAWVTERSNMLSMVFYLLAIYYFVYGYQNNKKNILIVCGLFILGMLSKASVIMLPVMLVLIALYLDGGYKFASVKKVLPIFVLAFGFGLINIYFERYSIGSMHDSAFSRPLLERLVVAGMIPLFYLKQLLYPVHIAFFYPKWEVDTASLLSYLPLFIVLLVSCAAVSFIFKSERQSSRLLAFLWLAFVVSLVPVLNIFYVYGMKFSFVADHWVYVASLPVFVALGLGANSLTVFLRTEMRNGIVILIVLTLAFMAWSQTAKYNNLMVLLLDTVAKTPSSFIAHNNLSVEYIRRHEWEKALTHADLAVKLYPAESGRALLNKAIALAQLNKYDEALAVMEALKEKQSYEYGEYFVLGSIYFSLGRYEESLVFLNTSLALNPDFMAAVNLRSQLYEKMQGTEKP